jgi:hypothetical protein
MFVARTPDTFRPLPANRILCVAAQATNQNAAILYASPFNHPFAGFNMQQLLKNTLPLVAALAFGMAAVPAQADSTSSAASSASNSVGSLSTSIQKSSTSSSGTDKVAQGQYKVIEMTEVAQQPDMVRVQLQAVASAQAQEFFLILPRVAAERGQLATGQIIEAQQRPYGLAFAAVNTTGDTSPFFLVLDDAWHRELESRPVVL